MFRFDSEWLFLRKYFFQKGDKVRILRDIAFESLCDISKTDLVACICEQQLSDAVHRKSEEDAKALTYQLAMEHDMYIMPADWSTASSAWCKCTGLPQRIRPVETGYLGSSVA